MLDASTEHRVLCQLHAIDVVIVDRDWVDNFDLQILQRSLESYSRAHVVTVATMYSASMLDMAIVGCFLLLHAIDALPRENIKLDVDRRLMASPAQSTFVLETNCSAMLCVGIVTHDPLCRSRIAISGARTEGAQLSVST